MLRYCLEQEKRELRNYELVMVLNPEVSDDNLSLILDTVGKFATQRGGAVDEINQWGVRKLAYPIKRFVEGKYVLARLTSEPGAVAKLEADLKLREEVLRYLLVRVGD